MARAEEAGRKKISASTSLETRVLLWSVEGSKLDCLAGSSPIGMEADTGFWATEANPLIAVVPDIWPINPSSGEGAMFTAGVGRAMAEAECLEWIAGAEPLVVSRDRNASILRCCSASCCSRR